MHLMENFGASAIGYLPFIAIILLLIFFHELGHFFVGRWCGVKVEVFSIGFGPEIFAFHDRKGTRWRVALIPLGGYVRFFGDANAASMPAEEKNHLMTAEERAVSMFHKPVWQRMSIVMAGPIANFVLAIFLFAATFYIYGYPNPQAVISTVSAGSPADAAGMRKGDRVLEVNGARVTFFREIPPFIANSSGRPVRFVVERDGVSFGVELTPKIVDFKDESGKVVQRPAIGIIGGGLVKIGLFSSLQAGIQETGKSIVSSYDFLKNLLIGHADFKNVTGVLGIAVESKKIASTGGLSGLLILAAVLSVSLGFFNLLPIPVLDGGHLVFYIIEALRGRPVGPRAQELSFGIGLVFILIMVVLVFGNDLSQRVFHAQ